VKMTKMKYEWWFLGMMMRMSQSILGMMTMMNTTRLDFWDYCRFRCKSWFQLLLADWWSITMRVVPKRWHMYFYDASVSILPHFAVK
jgi:hypothetical protein